MNHAAAPTADPDLYDHAIGRLVRYHPEVVPATGALLDAEPDFAMGHALAAYLSGWVRLYGGVTIEVFGHLGFALDDPEPMFEAMLADMRRQLTTPPTG